MESVRRRLMRTKVKKLIKAGLKIGRDTMVFPQISFFGSEPYLVHIGENCIIADGVRFITHDGAIRVINKSEENRRIDNKYGKIDIKDNVYLGEDSIIMPNVSIGPDACVLPGSVVYRDVPPNTIAGGNPAIVRHRMKEFNGYYRNLLFPYYERYCSIFNRHIR